MMFDFAKKMYFGEITTGIKSTQDRTFIKLLELSSIMVSASGVSKAIFLPTDPNELCERVKLFLNEKQAGNKSELIKEEINALVDNLSEYKFISTN